MRRRMFYSAARKESAPGERVQEEGTTGSVPGKGARGAEKG